MSLDDQLAELWAGETLTQIGRQVGASCGAVAGRLSRARKAGDSRFSARPPKPRSDNSCKRRRTPPGSPPAVVPPSEVVTEPMSSEGRPGAAQGEPMGATRSRAR